MASRVQNDLAKVARFADLRANLVLRGTYGLCANAAAFGAMIRRNYQRSGTVSKRPVCRQNKALSLPIEFMSKMPVRPATVDALAAL